MGLSASQARLLSITRRLNNNELQADFISNSKIQLATRNVTASEKYINALESTDLNYISYSDTGIQETVTLTFNTMSNYNSLKNQYCLMNGQNQILVNEKDAKNFEETDSLVNFLNRYGLIGTQENDPLFKAKWEQYEKDLDEYNKNKNQYPQIKLEEWKKEQTEIFNKAHSEWVLDYSKWLNVEKPKYESDLTAYNDFTNAIASLGSNTMYEAFSGIVGTSTSPTGYCYIEALNGNTGCYRHLLAHLVDYDTTRTNNISTDTYTTSTGVTGHRLTTSEGGLGELSAFNKISEALNLTFADDSAIFVTDGDDDYTGVEGEEKENKLKEAWDNYNNLSAQEAQAQATFDAAQEYYNTINSGDIAANCNTLISEKRTYITDTLNPAISAQEIIITAKEAEIATAEADITTAIANGDSTAELEAATRKQQALLEKEAAEAEKTRLETEKATVEQEITDLTATRDAALSSSISDAALIAEALTAMNDAQTALTNAQAAKVAAEPAINNWTLLSDYYLVKDASGNPVLDEEGNYTYNLKSLKQKAIDLDYAIANGLITDSTMLKNSLINFTDGDMQNLEMTAPTLRAEPVEPVLDLSNPPTFEYPEEPPTEPNFTEGTILDTAEAQWYINLWYRMNGSSTPEQLEEREDINLNLTYQTISGDITKSDFISEFGTNNFAVIKEEYASDSNWIHHALTNGIITMQQVILNTQGYLNWSGIEHTSTSDIREVESSAKIANAEAEYEKTIQEINIEDKKLDQKQRKLDTEHSALQKEMESIKNVMTKNVERSFTTFS